MGQVGCCVSKDRVEPPPPLPRRTAVGTKGKRARPCAHELVAFETPRGNYSCDGCGELFKEGYCMRGCRICDFDLCDECSASREARDVAAVESPETAHRDVVAMHAEVARLHQENARLQSAHNEVLAANGHLKRNLAEQESRLAWSKFDVLEEHYRGLEEHRQSLLAPEADQAAGSPRRAHVTKDKVPCRPIEALPRTTRPLETVAYNHSVPHMELCTPRVDVPHTDQAAGSPRRSIARSPQKMGQLNAYDTSVPHMDLCTPRVDVVSSSQ